MLKDKKLLGARVLERADADARVRVFLAESGLDAADGSTRRALLLLDEAQVERHRLARQDQMQIARGIRENGASRT